MNIEYFGTPFDQAGHNLYVLEKGQLNRNRRSFGSLPFNPEGLPYAGDRMVYKDGTVRFYNMAGFTICAIAGGCYDTRPGTKTIFFVEKDLPHEVFEEQVRTDPTVKKIIDKMPFDVKWSTLIK